jgi:elongation factor 3
MKLLIIRAMLMRADVLLLDEPTNHLDAASVQWLADYLNSQSHLTCLIVSHDTQFLDNVVTDIIHYEHKKLVYYHGSLSTFVRIHPEAKYYYDLSASTLKFCFPVPGRLDGINSNTRAILKMDDVAYTYPGGSRPTISNATVKVCLGSRIACRGVNGAGKSTLIKLLVQETQPDTDEGGNPVGEIWKHHNLRIAYVAQHSFHHVEQHVDVSPVEYMKQRFKGGVDSEDMCKVTAKVTEAEQEEMEAERKYGDILAVIGRRKNGRVMEYECTFFGQGRKDPNKYISSELLASMGLGKLVQQADIKVAALAAGLDVRPLLNKEIQGHLDLFNLEAEYGTHSKIRRLSGGQKVKLVLAASLWNKPHLIVLDEPTNYLDREALGALTQAIKAFAGGVVIISHNKEFTDAICSETWMVENGGVTVEGEVEEAKVEAISLRKLKKEIADISSETVDSNAEKGIGNKNATKKKATIFLENPKTKEALNKVELRKLSKLAQVSGVTLEVYVSRIDKNSPEWKWLSNSIK